MRREPGLGGTSRGGESSQALSPGARAVHLPSLPCLLSCSPFPFLGPRSPTPRVGPAFVRTPPPPPLSISLCPSHSTSLPPSLLCLCAPSLHPREFVGLPPIPPPPAALLLKTWQENNQGVAEWGGSWAGVCTPSLSLRLSDGFWRHRVCVEEPPQLRGDPGQRCRLPVAATIQSGLRWSQSRVASGLLPSAPPPPGGCWHHDALGRPRAATAPGAAGSVSRGPQPEAQACPPHRCLRATPTSAAC